VLDGGEIGGDVINTHAALVVAEDMSMIQPSRLGWGGVFCKSFVFQFDCNLLIFNRDELRCFLAKKLSLNG
jgi:hypothetical protein